MDIDQRLAAYLSGDLDADEREALEARLAGDAALREKLASIRAADAMLADLPDVELPDGFSERLRDRLAPELDAVLGDELAARRARRQVPGWVPAAAAAALVLVVGGGMVLGGGLGGQDEADTSSDAAAPEAMEEEAGGTEMDGDAAAELAVAPGPQVVADDRSITARDLQALAADPTIRRGLTAERLADDAAATATDWTVAMGGSRSLVGRDAVQDTAGADGGAATTESGGEQAARSRDESIPRVTIDGEVTPEDLDDVGRCLSELFEEAADPIVPLYAELATDGDGTPVIVYAALSPDAEGRYRRVEVWMIERATCTLRQFHQTDQGGG